MYAHTLPEAPPEKWQTLERHLAGVARLAQENAAAFGADNWGFCAGMLHDLGKATPDFQQYLRDSAEGKGLKGSVKHAVHGARWAVDKIPGLGMLLAYSIAGHHGGLPDSKDLVQRLEEAKRLETPEPRDLCPSVPKGFPFRGTSGNSEGFVLSFFLRMVYSCLVDADWLDTEAFMDPKRAAWRKGSPEMSELVERFFPRLEAMCAEASPTDVNRIRRQVLDDCLAAAHDTPGLFSLTVPTGGGKTLSSLAFALRHAQKHGLRRIVYVIPFMSIIEQNADVFREFIGHDAVVEHHSSFDPDQGRQDQEEENSSHRRARLASENWDAPLIATTAVQFFESLFAAKPSRCRKLHNLANSVVILDEAQMLPQQLLLPCLAAIRELTARYGASVVLCTATQPAVTNRDDFPHGLEGVREIVQDPLTLHQSLRRVRVQHLGTLEDSELASRLQKHAQALCIVNTRSHARELFTRLQGREGLVHLSANMTPQHRSEQIAGIKASLQQGRSCLVISTQLVEAGVDLDFPVVYRAAAGLDSIAQAAGRCDREGRLTKAAGAPAGKVFVFTPKEELPPGYFRITADKAAEVFRLGHEDLLSPQAVEQYFRLLFWQAGKDLDAKGILYDLATGAQRGNFPFKTVSENFRIIENAMRPLIVPYGEHEQHVRTLVGELEHTTAPGRILRKLQRHMVQLQPRVWKGLVDGGDARVVLEGVALLENRSIYDFDLGVDFDRQGWIHPETLLI